MVPMESPGTRRRPRRHSPLRLLHLGPSRLPHPRLLQRRHSRMPCRLRRRLHLTLRRPPQLGRPRRRPPLRLLHLGPYRLPRLLRRHHSRMPRRLRQRLHLNTLRRRLRRSPHPRCSLNRKTSQLLSSRPQGLSNRVFRRLGRLNLRRRPAQNCPRDPVLRRRLNLHLQQAEMRERRQ